MSEVSLRERTDSDRRDPAETAALGTMLFDLARTGDTAELMGLVARGIPVDLRDAAGNSLLMMAAYHGHAATVSALATRGADVDRTNDLGQTPLAGAVFKGHDEVVATLVALGASAYLGTPSAVATAVAFGRTELELLLRGIRDGFTRGKE
ncbi:MAG: ankyrin repeat domain-containing protein [Aeromicrobium sp.]